MNGPSEKTDQEALIPMEIEFREDQVEFIQDHVTDDADRSAVARRIFDLGIARAREIEQENERPI